MACCGKPVGCTADHAGCLFLRHPWKRGNVLGDTTAPCMAASVQDHIDGSRDWLRCSLRYGHAGDHEPVVVRTTRAAV